MGIECYGAADRAPRWCSASLFALEAALCEELLELPGGEALKVDSLLFVSVIVENNKVRVVMRNPFHLEVFPFLELLVHPQVLAHL